MKTVPFLLLTLLASASFCGAEEATVPSKDSRGQVIGLSSKWIEAPEVTIAPAAKNPFSMKDFEVIATAKTAETTATDAKPQSDRDLLEAIAARVDAKGRFVINGDVMLLVGGKKLKVGSKVSVTYQGLIYELEIASIDTSKFTVRYKTEEFTRPITQKPVKTQ